MFFLLLLPDAVAASGKIARGAVSGELYIYGFGGAYPDWVYWLYRSTDYGKTVYLHNDTVMVDLLAESVDTGELYKACWTGGRIYYSNDFGTDFILKTILGTDLEAIAGGYAIGELYASQGHVTKYSSDYGETFVDTGYCPGLVTCMSVGHTAGEIYCGNQHGEIYYSSNYGDIYELIVDLGFSIDILEISRGGVAGEIYFFGDDSWLYFSPNQGDTVYQQHYFGIDPEFLTGVVGGFSQGEVYILETFYDMIGKGDTYIHRSIDYGQTFTPYHVSSNHDDTLPPQPINDLTCIPSDSSIFLDWSPISKDIWSKRRRYHITWYIEIWILISYLLLQILSDTQTFPHMLIRIRAGVLRHITML